MLPWLFMTMLACSELHSAPRKQVELSPSLARSTWTAAHGLPQNQVTGLCQDSEGYLWVATFGGLARFDGRRFVNSNVANREDLSGNRLHQVLQDVDGTLWMRLVDVGLINYRDDSFVFVETPGEPRLLAASERGDLWGASDEGLFRILDHRIEMVRNGAVRGLLPVNDRVAWVSLQSGELIRHEAGEDLVLDSEAGLPGEALPALFRQTSGELW